MSKQDKIVRDPFKLSLGGMRAVSGYAAAPAISYDRLRKTCDEQPAMSDAGRSAFRWFLSLRTSS